MRNRHILLVDSSSTIRAALAAILRRAGYLVSAVESEIELVEYLLYHPNDLVIANYYAGNGDEVSQMIRTRLLCQNLPILVLAPGSYDQAFAQILQTEGDLVLQKPFNAREFRAAVDLLLNWPLVFDSAHVFTQNELPGLGVSLGAS